MSDNKAHGSCRTPPAPAIFMAGMLGLVVSAVLPAQTVYKTVDESGHATYSTTPPPAGVEAEVMMLEPAPSPGFVPPSATNSANRPEPTASGNSSAGPQIKEVRYSDMTLAELDAGCEAARQARITPMREREIALCKASRTDADYCERYYRDLGEATVSQDGTPIPRMFNDLPECKLAEDERRRRDQQGLGEP